MTDRLKRTIEACRLFIDRRDDALALPEDGARFCHMLVLATGARRCLEIGTSYGYSGLWIGGAAQANEGKLLTIDNDRRKSDIAGAYFADAGLSDVIECRTGAGLDVLPALKGPFDFVLSDADKENLVAYLEILKQKLVPRAVVLTDNITSHPEQTAPFVRHIRNDPDFHSMLVPIGNGMELSVRRGT